MSRIRGIEAKDLKILKDHQAALQNAESRRNKTNEARKRRTDTSLCDIGDVEKQQITELLQKLPKLDAIFDVHRKIGEGTFSSVYLGSLKKHSELPDTQKPWFAIKHLVPTAHPARIEHELKCLQEIGGKHNVIGVELCLRHLDTIVFVMPYIPHKKFSEYVGDMDAEEVKQYMRALLVALRHVHSFGVIHRDVKPSNFLYDRENKRYLLVDFGLAQRVCPRDEPAPPPAHSRPAPAAAPSPRAAPPAGCKRPRDEDDVSQNAKRMALDLSIRSRSTNVVPYVPQRLILPKVQIPRQNLPKIMPVSKDSKGGDGPAHPPPAHSQAARAAGAGTCACANVGGVCGACASRAAARAPRAGTQGFRPPEVLLKSPRQDTAVDAWAAGVVLLSALTARYPFFRAADDVAALAELVDLLGTEPLQRAAGSMGRRLVASTRRRGLCLRKLTAHLRGAEAAGRAGAVGRAAEEGPCTYCRQPIAQCLCRDESIQAHEFAPAACVAGFPDAAFSLALRLLDPDPRSRLSAADALRHAFLADT